jgi:hypothetical protein
MGRGLIVMGGPGVSIVATREGDGVLDLQEGEDVVLTSEALLVDRLRSIQPPNKGQ